MTVEGLDVTQSDILDAIRHIDGIRSDFIKQQLMEYLLHIVHGAGEKQIELWAAQSPTMALVLKLLKT